jgi:uncharacterized 2Fe-2S/4Fe-4S cluster protein (DUF4445 family)
MEMKASDIDRIYIAGGFGTFLNIDRAILIGLLPDLARDKFKFIGNSSLVGAREALVSGEALRDAGKIAGKMTYVELDNDNVYNEEYVKSLFFPHTDLERFPTVKKQAEMI